MERREFLRACTAGASLACADLAANPTRDAKPRLYTRTRLVGSDGKPLTAAKLSLNTSYVFEYPFESTPCFLLRLDRAVPPVSGLKTEAGSGYAWGGGVGADKAIVAYSAICAHKLAYPSQQVNFINFQAKAGPKHTQDRVIACCADGSIYDATAGAKVLAGPAPQPLATILLEHDTKTDGLTAIGTLGGEKFEQFFSQYAFRLQLERGKRAKNESGDTARVVPIEQYTRQSASC